MRFMGVASAIMVLSSAALLSACVPQDHGWANAYMADQYPKISVQMPPNAPSISQEYRFNSNIAGHEGIDVVGRVGSPVIAAADGIVSQSYYEPLYGNRVVVDHGMDASGKRTRTVYKHLRESQVSEGTTVARGQQIATLGATGTLAGGIPHLHFEIHRSTRPESLGPPVDPHLLWVNGVGKVTCFSPDIAVPLDRFKLTYPVPCR